MLTHLNRLRSLAQRVVLGLIIGMLGCVFGMTSPATADMLSDSPQYIAADGQNLTAIAECLPKKLSEPNLARALAESKNDFLEKVFDLKDNYDDYKLDATEVEYLASLEGKDVTPQVKQ